MEEIQKLDEFDGVSEVLGIFKKIDPEVREKVIKSVAALLEINVAENNIEFGNHEHIQNYKNNNAVKFSDDRTMLPKEFLFEKQPQTDVERIACLAYYLTHYRDQPHFKTTDINELNIESAQKPFSNTSTAIDNATRSGYLAPLTKGQKQISAIGEKFVQALPDRTLAKESMNAGKSKRKVKKNTSNKVSSKQ